MLDKVGLQVPCDEDASFFYDVYATARKPELEGLGWPREEIDAFIRMQYETRELACSKRYPLSDTLLIRVGPHRAGKITTAITHDEVVLVDIALLPAYRNQGIGTGLVQSLQTAARELGKPLSVRTLQSDPAVAFYLRLGFEVKQSDYPYCLLEWRQEREMAAVN